MNPLEEVSHRRRSVLGQIAGNPLAGAAPQVAQGAMPAPKVMPGPKTNPLGEAFGRFAKGFAPQQTAAVDEQHKAKALEGQKKALAWVQQTAQIPAAQRAQFTIQNAQAIARDTGKPVEAIIASAQDPNAFSDQAMQQAIAGLSASMGEGPEKKTYQGANLGDGGYGSFDPSTGTLKTLREPTPDPTKAPQPVKPDIKEGANGNYWERDAATGVWKDTGVRAPPPSTGVTINMPGNVREAVDEQGRPIFVGIDPKNPNAGFQKIEGANPASTLMGAETRGKFLSMAPNAYKSIDTLRGLFQKGGDDPLSGVDDVVAQVFSGVPLVGEPAARGIGGQNWQDFDQAWNTIELGVHIPSGAAVTPSEAQRFLRANKPALNESTETKLRKLDNVERFYKGLEAGFRGDFNALNSLIGGGTQAPAATALPPDLDADEQAMIQELRQRGMPEDQIQAIINGQ